MKAEKSVEAIIQEAVDGGKFKDLKGKGKPLDLAAYFKTPEELRLAYSALKNAGFVPAEADLLQEIAALKEELASAGYEAVRGTIAKRLRDRQLQFDVMLDRQKKTRRR